MNTELTRFEKRNKMNEKIRQSTLKIANPSMKEMFFYYINNILYIILLICLCVVYALSGGTGIIYPYIIR